MIEAKVTCDTCGASVVVPLTRCYESGEWRITGLGRTLGGKDLVPKNMKGWEYGAASAEAKCPKCAATERVEADAKRPRTLEDRVVALETKALRDRARRRRSP